jgi:hypothetical protein
MLLTGPPKIQKYSPNRVNMDGIVQSEIDFNFGR